MTLLRLPSDAEAEDAVPLRRIVPAAPDAPVSTEESPAPGATVPPASDSADGLPSSDATSMPEFTQAAAPDRS